MVYIEFLGIVMILIINTQSFFFDFDKFLLNKSIERLFRPHNILKCILIKY